jgi:hypothetical protein
VETNDNPARWLEEDSLRGADRKGELTGREIVAGHEAGHVTVAWSLGTWPHVVLDPIAEGGRTSRLPARNDHESIAIITAGIEADCLQGIDSVEVRLSQAQDWNNLRTRYPSARMAQVSPARNLAKHLLLENRDAWWRIRQRLLVADHIGWREIALIATGEEPSFKCIRCNGEFEVIDPSLLTRDLDGRPVCTQCATQIPSDERLY